MINIGIISVETANNNFFLQIVQHFCWSSDNGKDFGGSIYQKVSDKLDCGVSMKWSAGSADTLFGVGAKFALDADTSLHAKINNKSLIGLGYQQKLRPGQFYLNTFNHHVSCVLRII